jgi:Protein of unknown function (DUF1538)
MIETLIDTIGDVFPVIALLVFFQLFVLKKSIPNLKRVVLGFVFVLIGLALFLVGLETALFPIGKIMADQLSSPGFVFGSQTTPENPSWWAYRWMILFGVLIGFATTIAEPALIAVAHKANEVSRGAYSQWGLRLAVATGVAIGIGIGTFRIITGTPLWAYILVGYLIVIIQTIFAPKRIIPLAYDSGGVTTSTVTVPLVAAVGLGLCEAVPGRDPALDGFGLIAFASVFPIITVLGYAQFAKWKSGRISRLAKED